MKKWKVEISDLLIGVVEVEAETKEEAKAKVAAKNILLDPDKYGVGGNRVTRKLRIFNKYVFVGRFEEKGQNYQKFLNTDKGVKLSDKGTEFDTIEQCRECMEKFDPDKRHWKIMRLKRTEE